MPDPTSNKAGTPIDPRNVPGNADITEAKDGEDLHHRLAMNVIGTFLDGTNDLEKFIEEEESYKEVKKWYTELGKSIVKLQDNAAKGINDPELDGKIKEQIKQLCTNIKIANKQKKSNFEAMADADISMILDTGPNPQKIFEQFQEAKSNKDSTLFISTENRAQVIAEYKDYTEKNPLTRTKRSIWEKQENEYEESFAITEDKQGNKTVKGVARSENDGRIMARKVAEINGYNPNKKYHISLGMFKKNGNSAETKATWYELKAALGYMREHRKYGATASFSLGKEGKAMTLESWAKNQEENAVNLQLPLSNMDMSKYANLTEKWKRGGSRVLDSINIAGELLINEARELALEANPRLDTSNLAALNVATYGKLSEAMQNLEAKLGNEKGNMFSQDTIVGKVEKAMTKDDSFLNRSSVKQVIEAAEKSMRLNMGAVEISQLSQGFANAPSEPNNSNTKTFDVVFKNGAPVEGQNTTEGKEQQKIKFSKNENGQRVFSEAEIKEEQKYTEKSFLGTRLSIPSTWQTGVDDVITSPYWATCALINHTWQSCKVLTKGAFAGLYTTGMATYYIGQKMTGSMAEGETFVDKTLGSYGGGYKFMTEFSNSVSSNIGFKSVSQWIRSLPGSLKQSVKSYTGLKELSITKGFMYIASGMASNPLSVIYNSLPAVSGRSIKHKMNEIFYADPNTSISSPGEGLKQNITARDIIDTIKDNSFNLENMNVRHLVRRGIPDEAIENLNKNREVYNVLSSCEGGNEEQVKNNIKRSLLENFKADLTKVENDTGVVQVKEDKNGNPYLETEVTNSATETTVTVTHNVENDLVDDIMKNVSVTDDKGDIDMAKAAETLATALATTENKALNKVKESIGVISNTLKGKTPEDAIETIKNMSSDKPITKDSLVEMARAEIEDKKTSKSAIKKATKNVMGAFGVDENNRPNVLAVTQHNNNSASRPTGGL